MEVERVFSVYISSWFLSSGRKKYFFKFPQSSETFFLARFEFRLEKTGSNLIYKRREGPSEQRQTAPLKRRPLPRAGLLRRHCNRRTAWSRDERKKKDTKALKRRVFLLKNILKRNLV